MMVFICKCVAFMSYFSGRILTGVVYACRVHLEGIQNFNLGG